MRCYRSFAEVDKGVNRSFVNLIVEASGLALRGSDQLSVVGSASIGRLLEIRGRDLFEVAVEAFSVVPVDRTQTTSNSRSFLGVAWCAPNMCGAVE